jgi:hypothetical protein
MTTVNLAPLFDGTNKKTSPVGGLAWSLLPFFVSGASGDDASAGDANADDANDGASDDASDDANALPSSASCCLGPSPRRRD